MGAQVMVEYFVKNQNEDCTKGQDSMWCEGVVQGNWTGCAVKLPPMQFETGRSDCITSRHPAYLPEPENVEVHPEVRGDGKTTTTYFREQFGFTMRETVAIMGAHTIGKVHPEISLIPYSWTRETRTMFNNEYYRIMAKKPMYALTTCVGNALSQPGESDFLSVLEGKKSTLEPLNITSLTGKVSWFHTYMRCPDCKGLALGEFVDSSAGKWKELGGVDYCCGLEEGKPLPEGHECMPECILPGRKDEAFTNADIGLMFDFQYDTEKKRFNGCPGFDNLEDKAMTVGRIVGKPDCPYNKMITEEGTPIHTYVEEYAEDQDLWTEDFGLAFTRMLRNGYGEQGNMDALVEN